jgi:SAM-dependent methyltransferase
MAAPVDPKDGLEPQGGTPVDARPGPADAGAPSWPMACPVCRTPLGDLPIGAEGPFSLACTGCGRTFARRAGIWDCLPEERAAYFAPFLEQYRIVRYAEGRGEVSPDELRCLPWAAPDDPLAWQWYIRAATFEYLIDRVLPLFGREGIRVLDLGAGTGWLSYRLAQIGHAPLAVDLTIDPRDGLGAAHHFDAALDRSFPRVRAEFDRLPLADGAADLVVYNASFHYSADYAATLAEGRRVLAPGGRLVIMDSPIYFDPSAGEAMVAARKAAFSTRFGFPSDALASREFLTHAEIGAIGRALGLHWREFAPPYGWRWSLRRRWRRLRTGRESARFVLLVAERLADAGSETGPGRPE